MIEILITTILDKSPYGVYFIAAVLAGAILWKIFKFVQSVRGLERTNSEFCQSHNDLVKSHNDLLIELRGYFVEINHRLQALETAQFGNSNSPIQLKPKYKEFVKSSGLAKQIEVHKPEILELLNQRSFDTFLEAQNAIADVAALIRTNKVIDFKEIDQAAYETGIAPGAIVPIMTIYLWEVLIPELMPRA